MQAPATNGTLVLNGSGSIGGIEMDQCALLVNGSLTSGIDGDGTLGGTGTITGGIVISTVQPGPGSSVLGLSRLQEMWTTTVIWRWFWPVPVTVSLTLQAMSPWGAAQPEC